MASRSVNMYLGLFGLAMIVSTREGSLFLQNTEVIRVHSQFSEHEWRVFFFMNMKMWRLV